RQKPDLLLRFVSALERSSTRFWYHFERSSDRSRALDISHGSRSLATGAGSIASPASGASANKCFGTLHSRRTNVQCTAWLHNRFDCVFLRQPPSVIAV